MNTYIKKTLPNKYIEFKDPLDSSLFRIGNTWEDYLSNKWVLLTDDLLIFKESNPTASVQEVFNMELFPKPKISLSEVISNKIAEVTSYDCSEDVNSFYLNNLKVWLDKATRVGLMNSLNIEKNSGKEDSILWFNGTSLLINIDSAILMLSSVELYALECYNITATHINNISNLGTVEEVDNYNYTLNYPDKLSFNI